MNKTDYLIKKGLLADPNNGTIWVVKSTREGVEIDEVGIHKTTRFLTNELHEIKEFPTCIRINYNEKFFEQEYHGSGFGDLWGSTIWASKDKDLAYEYFTKETERVNTKYLTGVKEGKIIN